MTSLVAERNPPTPFAALFLLSFPEGRGWAVGTGGPHRLTPTVRFVP